MAIAYNEFDARVDAIVAAFQAQRSGTLGRELPSPVTVHKGPYRDPEPSAGNFAVFISRQANPDVKYDMGQQTADVTMRVYVAAASYSLADEADLEGYINVFSANVMALLFSLVKKTGTGGWYKGIWRGSVADELRTEKQQTVELEVHIFDVTFEVNYA
ncbi:MAG TPA: hypothetical protein PLJ35_05330 [Anaerolineae bacterium]|nr:hypothetical protein [Anaerolineae bacterium]